MATTTTTTTHTIKLTDLPVEIILDIDSYLTYHETVAFRSTCWTAATVVPVRQDQARKHAALKAVLVAEEAADHKRRAAAHANQIRWAQVFPSAIQHVNNIHLNRTTAVSALACYSCLKVLPRSAFHLRQVTGKRSHGHADFSKRFCLDCGVAKAGSSTASNLPSHASTRATRCQRCWAISHTERPIARSGGKMCGACETIVGFGSKRNHDDNSRTRAEVQ